jgi:hypothetical protein
LGKSRDGAHLFAVPRPHGIAGVELTHTKTWKQTWCEPRTASLHPLERACAGWRTPLRGRRGVASVPAQWREPRSKLRGSLLDVEAALSEPKRGRWWVGEPPPRAVFGALAEDAAARPTRESRVNERLRRPGTRSWAGAPKIACEGAGAPLHSRAFRRFPLK